MKLNALVPEFAVMNVGKSLQFYCDLLGFALAYERPEEGFALIALGDAQLMLDQIDRGRTFGDMEEVLAQPLSHPKLGHGLNVQIQVPEVAPMLKALATASIDLFLPLEDKWYRKDDGEIGNRQFVVADPDGYLLRFVEPLGVQ